ncbi:MAG: ABC transporter ATP-binding protein [Bacteroidota bacterium]
MNANITVTAVNISKRYSHDSAVGVLAVADVNLEVQRGEILLVSGPNGSGKTTLLSMLGCLVRPTSGSISVIGREVTALGQRELTEFRLKHIGFIFQTFRLLHSLSVLENIELILNLTGIRRPRAGEQAGLLLHELGISHRADFLPNALSGGEKQRVAIARALANDPELLLADEPTGSLDSHAGQATIELLCEAAQRRSKTVIIVSHDVRIQHYAHRVLRMEDGRIVEEIRR